LLGSKVRLDGTRFSVGPPDEAVEAVPAKISKGKKRGMGTFKGAIDLGNPQGDRWETVQALADSGSFYRWVPEDVLDRLGVPHEEPQDFKLADRQIVKRDVALTWVRYQGRRHVTIVVFGNRGSDALLGAYTLEGFALAVDPVNERLFPMSPSPGYGARAAQVRTTPTPTKARAELAGSSSLHPDSRCATRAKSSAARCCLQFRLTLRQMDPTPSTTRGCSR